MRPWAIVLIVGMAAVTYFSRAGFFSLARQMKLHPLLERALDYVPVSILAALVFPAVLAPARVLSVDVHNTYLWAALCTAVLLFVTRRGWVAIVLGIASMLALRALLGS